MPASEKEDHRSPQLFQVRFFRRRYVRLRSSKPEEEGGVLIP